jgi:hypothetical protein
MIKINKAQLSTAINGRIVLIPIGTFFVENGDSYDFKINGVLSKFDKNFILNSADIFEDGSVSDFVRNDFLETINLNFDILSKSLCDSILPADSIDFQKWKYELLCEYIKRYAPKLCEDTKEKKSSSLTQIFFKDNGEKIATNWCPFKGNTPPTNWKPTLR